MRRIHTARETERGRHDTQSNNSATHSTDTDQFPAARNPHSTSKGTHVSSQRTRRTLFRKSNDPCHALHYGTPICEPKNPRSIRILLQNIKGLVSQYSTGEDQEYYMTHLRDLQIDIAGLTETNTAWQHQSLRYNYNSRARKAGNGLAKTSFGSPSATIEQLPPNETFQAGGSVTTCLGPWTTPVYGNA